MPPQALPSSVSDARANKPELIVHAAEVLSRSEQKRKVFEAIYWHKKKVKAVDWIAQRTGLTRMRVLQLGKSLVNDQLVGQTTLDERVAYETDSFYQQHKTRVLKLAAQPKRIAEVTTKRNPKGTPSVGRTAAGGGGRAEFLTVDGIDSFDEVRTVAPGPDAAALSEEDFRLGVQRILEEAGIFKDWGGEQNDLFTTRLRVRGKRRAAAFAFKGPGLRGVLKPRNMGKNGDQVQRLFRSPADVFLVQFHGQIDSSVIEQMKELAISVATKEKKPVYYGVIDGQDSSRLIVAYPTAFEPNGGGTS